MGFFDSLTMRFADTFSGGPGTSGASYKWVLIVLIVLFFIGVVLVIARYPKSIFGGGSGIDGKKNEVQSYWKSVDPTQKLEVSFKEAGSYPSFTRYTVMVDMIWGNTRVSYTTSDAMPYRHIVHRGTDDTVKALEAASLDDATSDSIIDKLPNGLPEAMNPGIMVDPVKNDMIIFIDTEKNNDVYRESVRIPDIPLGESLSLTVVVSDRMMEVYVNCRLEVSKILEGLPRTIPRMWYGLSGPYRLPGAVQNLRIWNTPLTANEIRGMCKKKPVFSSAMTCESASANLH